MVCCTSSHRRGWDQSSSAAQRSPGPAVWPAVSDHRDTSSPGSGIEDTAGTGHGGTAAGTGELHSLTSSRIFSDRKNVPNHQILPYLCHTGLLELLRHSSKPAEPAADRVDTPRCDTPERMCGQHSLVRHRTPCHTAALFPDHNAWADWSFHRCRILSQKQDTVGTVQGDIRYYKGGYSPRRSFSSHTCHHSCEESHCAATLGLSLYHRNRCRRSVVSEQHFGRLDNANLQMNRLPETLGIEPIF